MYPDFIQKTVILTEFDESIARNIFCEYNTWNISLKWKSLVDNVDNADELFP